MRIFDSLKNRAWSGKALSAINDTLTLFKNTSIFQNVKIEKGNYVLRATARRRVGSKGFLIELFDQSNKVFKTMEIDSPNNSLSEVTCEFSVPDGLVIKRIRLYRPDGAVGSFEVSKIVIDDLDHINTSNLSISHSKIPVGYQRSHLDATKPKLDKKDISKSVVNFDKNNLKIAFIIDNEVSSGELIFFKNISSEISKDTSICLLYVGMLSEEFSRSSSIKEINSMNDLRLELKKTHYSHIVYYHSNAVTDLLVSLTENGDIKSSIINVKPYDRLADPNPKIKYSFGINPGIFGRSSDMDNSIGIGIDVDLFSPNNNSEFKKNLKNFTDTKIIGLVFDDINFNYSFKYFCELIKNLDNFYFIIFSNSNIETLKLNLSDNNSILSFDNLDDKIYGIIDGLIFMNTGGLNFSFNILKAISSGVPIFADCITQDDNISLIKITGDPLEDSKIIIKDINNLEFILNGMNYIYKKHNINEIVKKLKNEYFIFNYYNNISFKKIVISGGYV